MKRRVELEEVPTTEVFVESVMLSAEREGCRFPLKKCICGKYILDQEPQLVPGGRFAHKECLQTKYIILNHLDDISSRSETPYTKEDFVNGFAYANPGMRDVVAATLFPRLVPIHIQSL